MISVSIQEAGYQQNEAIIRNIEFTIPNAQIVGIIGGNGAGKSTTIQTIMGTIPYSKHKSELEPYGYVPERPILYDYLTLWEHIHLLIQSIGQKKTLLEQRAKELCKVFRLENKLNDYPIKFSKGMQQKVMLILAFTPRYDFYILDEPFMGLDPQAIRKLLIMIKECKTLNASFLISTHALDTAEKLCDSFVCLHDGRMIKTGTLAELQKHRSQTLLEIFDELIEGVENAAV
ncbi:ABC transporter ATP-binding protein [Lysinibacillus sp. SGAir0095]|uniref:ABC transporter ATP-binding protein n=1 Tax=Lysinibacillus sp. SGAir0095 TaxID=2070463 RepID=UPI0010CCC6A3|nr:ABC transporter ATP-binding protein [Lysinibacillus sp. SGAir0095]QCR32349.1 ABC transporter ATP-binding protein [Lysinibacillus sp. SGAir0095]